MSTKFCPNCNAEVPSVANLCKHCFHDFNVPVPKRKSPWWTLLFLVFGTSIVSAMAFAYMMGANRSYRVTVDEETASIVFTTTFADHTEADRVYWKDIAAIEYVKNAKPRPFEIVVVTSNGKRFVYEQAGEPLDFHAAALAETTGRPVVNKDNYDGPSVER